MYLSFSELKKAFGGYFVNRHTIASIPKTIWALGFCSFFTDISSEMLVVTLPLYLSASVGVSILLIGVYDGLYGSLSVIFRILSGYVCDKTGWYKRIAGTGYGLSFISKCGLAFFNSHIYPIIGFMAIDRLGKGIRTSPRDALIAKVKGQEKDVAFHFSIHRLLDNAGAMLGPIFAFIILLWLPENYATVFFISMMVSVIGLAIFIIYVPRDQPKEEKTQVFTKKGVFQRPLLILLSLVLILNTFSVSESLLFLAVMQESELGSYFFPLLFAVSALTFCCTVVPIARISRRWGLFPVYLLGFVILVIVYALLMLSILPSYALILIAALIGIHFAATDGILCALVTLLVSKQYLTSALAISTSIVVIGKLLSSVGFGALWHFMGLQQALIWASIGLVCAITLFFAIGKYYFSDKGI
ncbi:hypothetical protein BS333_05245 [Vibrio azureus]|uniref:Putative major facilitator superfamily transporter n=1 Tax=Vibrio azureus NBRC 104587 TaxID=1219077 RepID=U3CDH9_9VIBR|nr:MFS transporter [Vibrio azureus]AUI85828.1 hypothetical protein BS333_05245 [Vibrio azureus]GAD76388.1 putative major facilitator superfamily transporter [Vibrio azureus NBRC 104587]